MMRTNLQPLAHLVDAAAEKWLAVEGAAAKDQRPVWEEITARFRIGDQSKVTFNGLRYQLRISRNDAKTSFDSLDWLIDVHEIVTDN